MMATTTAEDGKGAKGTGSGAESDAAAGAGTTAEGGAAAGGAKPAESGTEDQAPASERRENKGTETGLGPGGVIKLGLGPKWRIVRELGAGNFGKVLGVGRKREKTGGWEVAGMKIGIGENDFQTRWEGWVLAYLRRLGQTSGVVRYVGHGTAAEPSGRAFPYVCMEILHPTCPTLGALVKLERGRKLSVGKATRIAIGMLNGLYTMHRVGLVHRDLKPDNVGILPVPNDHSVVLIDLGMARFYTDGAGEVREPRTYPGQKGTPSFMSARVVSWRDGSRADDLWSWFYTLVELVKGEMLLPWDELNLTADEFEREHLEVKAARFPADQLLLGLPEQLYAVRLHLLGLAFEDAPDYQFLFSQLAAVLRRCPNQLPTDPLPPYRN